MACDFEHIFKCGYTTSTTGTVSWERVSNKIVNGSSKYSEGKLTTVLCAILPDEFLCSFVKKVSQIE